MGSSVILPPPGQPVEGPDPNFHVAAVPNIVTFNFSQIGPPSTLYIQRDDRLHVKIKNSVAGMGFIVSARLLMPIGPLPGQPDKGALPDTVTAQQERGWINTIQQELFPTATRAANEFDIALAEGYLLSVGVAFDFALGTVQRGQAYVTAGLQRGAASGFRFTQLIADAIGADMDLGWPGGALRAPTEGPGFLHTVQVANPAAGADFALVVPTNTRFRVTSFTAVFAASAAAANRQPAFIIDDGVNIYWESGLPVNIVANAVETISLTGTQAPTAINTGILNSVLPPVLFLPAGHRVRSSTTSIQAGDQWSSIWFGVEEWINA